MSSLGRECCVVHISPFLRELIGHVVGIGMLDKTVPEHFRLIGVVVDQLAEIPTVPLRLPMPRDRRAGKVAEQLRRNPGDPRPLDQIARGAGASKRTIERLFRAETGLTMGQWRRQLRLLSALKRLAGGEAVTNVALGVGYESPSAFIAMFKSALGTTPSRYYDREGGAP